MTRREKYLADSQSFPTCQERFEETSVAYHPRPKSAVPRPKSSAPKRPRTGVRRPIMPTASDEVEDEVQNEVHNEVEVEEVILPIISRPKQTIRNIRVGENSTQVKMTPIWFEQEDQQAPLRGIVYPPGVTDQRPFDSIARYRALTNKTNNFRRKCINVNKNATETLILALHNFAEQFGGDLSFTKRELSFSQSAQRTACGIANLGSAHLLATNSIPTAKYFFHTKLNYKKDLAKSDETMENFILSFATAIAETLGCENDYVRVLSVEKNDDDNGNAKIEFGITTPEQIETEILAEDLESHARSGFSDNKILKFVQSGEYKSEWGSLITYLQLRAEDFAIEYNMDYRKNDSVREGRRGGYPYYVPLGWFRHALDVSTKYPGSQVWLDYQNISGAWPVAFHGTRAEIVNNITRDGLSTQRVERDALRDEAVQQGGSKFNKPGLYLATHCTGGAHSWYTQTFSVFVSPYKVERFRVAFQCRVKPGEFTIHTCPITGVETWRVVDPTAVRPYGLLVRKRIPPKREGDESEDD